MNHDRLELAWQRSHNARYDTVDIYNTMLN